MFSVALIILWLSIFSSSSDSLHWSLLALTKLKKIQNDLCLTFVSYSMCILQRLPGLVSQNRKSGNLHANQYHCTLPAAGQRKARQKLDYIHFLWLDNIKTCAKHYALHVFFHIVSRVSNACLRLRFWNEPKTFQMELHISYLIASNDDECVIFCIVKFLFDHLFRRTFFFIWTPRIHFDKVHISWKGH